MDRRSVALGFSAVAAAGAIWMVSGSYPSTADLSEGLGAAFFPRTIAVAMGLIGLVIAVQGSLRPSTGETAVDDEPASRQLWTPVAFIVVILAYFLALRTVGFSLATMPFLAAEMALLRVPVIRAIVYATLATLVTFLLFEVALEVPLPEYVLTLV